MHVRLIGNKTEQLGEIFRKISRKVNFASERNVHSIPNSQVSSSVMSDSLRPHGLQHTRLPYLSPPPRAYSNSCPSSRWCHPTISSSVVPFSSAFNLSQHQGLFQWVSFLHQVAKLLRVSASASVLPMNIQDWCPFGKTGLISLQSKGLSRVFSNTTVQKHQFFGTQLSS